MLEKLAGIQDHQDQNTIHNRWLSFADEVFQNLESRAIHHDDMDKTFTLLSEAKKIIAQSRQQIQEQEDRIQLLQRLTTTDELTRLTNRRGVIKAFERELDRVNRDVSRGGLFIMIDLDNFKMINDTHGHAAGDAALKVIAETLKTDSRAMDIVGRIGGDEFVLLFVNTTRKAALERAQFLIKKLNSLSFIWNGEEINLCASLGLKEYNKNSTVRQIFTAADADMYANKKENKINNTKQNIKEISISVRNKERRVDNYARDDVTMMK